MRATNACRKKYGPLNCRSVSWSICSSVVSSSFASRPQPVQLTAMSTLPKRSTAACASASTSGLRVMSQSDMRTAHFGCNGAQRFFVPAGHEDPRALARETPRHDLAHVVATGRAQDHRHLAVESSHRVEPRCRRGASARAGAAGASRPSRRRPCARGHRSAAGRGPARRAPACARAWP